MSLIKVDDLVKKVEKMGMPAVAVTDWGNLFGALHFQKAAKKSEGRVKPIYGMELGVLVENSGPFLRHLVLLAENNEGFKNLCRLSTLAHTEYGFSEGEVRAKIPLDIVLQNTQGLIALTGGLKGILNSFIIQDQETLALQVLDRLQKGFGPGNLFLELQETGLTPQSRCNQTLQHWAASRGLPLVATTDAHYFKRDDSVAHETWMMVERKMSLDQNPRSRLASEEFYLKTPEEMKEAFYSCPEAIENTLKIAERCNVKLKFVDDEGKRIYHLPDFSRKDESSGTLISSEELFEKECFDGLKKRLEELKISEPKKIEEYEARLRYELQIISNMGFAGYYLIVADFVNWSKANNIPVGPGRGSGAGSLAAYVLNITDLDPLEYGLLFERFLNPERVSMPDFDIDFCQARRHEVIRYVADRYGQDHVCQIITFAKEQSKNAIKDVGRVFGLSFSETNRITKLIPSVQMKPLTIAESLESVKELAELVAQDTKVQQVIDIGQRIEGSLRQPGVHAAGVIIAGRPLHELSPMSKDVNGNLICQWDMKSSEEAGLVKFDFLGLVTLDLMHLACQWINRHDDQLSKNMTYANIPMEDPRIYQLISQGDTLGVFQLESSGMQNLCVRMKPDRFSDICAIAALFRPGPLEAGMVDDYINRKHGRARVEYFFPDMEKCLAETYGVIVYQEQVQEIAKVIAGYTLGGADLLRRAMGKKIKAEMEAQRADFVAGCEKQGYTKEKAGELFDLIEKFAGYGFNKSHSAAYAKLAVQTAYLKAVYPTEFFTSLLTIEKDDADKLSRYIQDARTRGIEVLPPDVNESLSDFAIASNKIIRFGLSAIKNVGEGAVEEIIRVRNESGPFTDLYDFLRRVPLKKLNKRTLECLVQAGAFDSLAVSSGMEKGAKELRSRYLASLEKAIEWANKMVEEQEAGQISLFGGGSSGQENMIRRPDFTVAAFLSDREIFTFEKTLLGVYISGSPLDKFLDKAKSLGAQEIFNLQNLTAKSQVTVAALVAEIRELRVKRGRMAGEFMGVLKLEDHTGQVEMVSFPEHYKEYSKFFKSGQPLLIRAELDFEEDKPKLVAGNLSYGGGLSVEDLSSVEEKWPKRLSIGVNLDALEGKMAPESLYAQIAEILQKHRGPVPVGLLLHKAGLFQTQMDLPETFSVLPKEALHRELEHLIAVPGALCVRSLH
jgi:DNA polymerase III subunit alpha